MLYCGFTLCKIYWTIIYSGFVRAIRQLIGPICKHNLQIHSVFAVYFKTAAISINCFLRFKQNIFIWVSDAVKKTNVNFTFFSLKRMQERKYTRKYCKQQQHTQRSTYASAHKKGDTYIKLIESINQFERDWKKNCTPIFRSEKNKIK